MRRLSALLTMVLLGCGGGQSVAAQQVVTVEPGGGSSTAWIGGSPVQTRVVVGADGETYVGVWIDAPDQAVRTVERAPMAISLVIDTSGSMAGDKITNARMAASSLLETLSDGDIVSIYAFSNGVMEIAPPTALGRGTRGALMQRIQNIVAGGGTNMWDGMQVGVARMREAPASHPIRRVVLISDGHANIGPSDPMSLGNLAAQSTEWGTQVSAIGVGLDYDENTLGALAVRSAGRLYHLEQPHQMAAILERELQMLANTIAVNAYIEVVPAPGVTLLEGTTTGATLQNGRLRMPIGSVFAGQQREVLFRARVDTHRAGARELARAAFVYEDPEDRAEHRQTAALRYEVTPDASAAQRSLAPRVHAMVANHQATQAQLHAARLLNEGQNVAAAEVLQRAERDLDRAVQAAPASPASQQLRVRQQSLQSGSARARRATTREESRAGALDFADEAMEAEGF